MSYHNGPKIITNGLVLCLDAASSKSYRGTGTTWTDLSGKAYNGTFTNGPTYNIANQGSIVFDGTNDYIDFGKTNTALQFGTTGSFTISIWFKLSTLDQTCTLVSHGNSAYNIYYNGGGINSIIFAQAGVGNDFSEPYLTVNSTDWTFATVINNIGTNTIHYINDQYIKTTTFTNGNISSPYIYNNNFTIGYSDNEGLFLNGRVSIVYVHNRALSGSEILQNYRATKSRYGL